MYTGEIIQYLIWPAFIILSWYAVRYALAAWEKGSADTSEKE